jgi:hypothetical protein
MPDNDLCETPQPTQQSVLNRSGKDKFLLVLNLPQVLRKQTLSNDLLKIDPYKLVFSEQLYHQYKFQVMKFVLQDSHIMSLLIPGQIIHLYQ